LTEHLAASLVDEENFRSVVIAGPPDEDEAPALLPVDIEPRKAPVNPWLPARIRETVLARIVGDAHCAASRSIAVFTGRIR